MKAGPRAPYDSCQHGRIEGGRRATGRRSFCRRRMSRNGSALEQRVRVAEKLAASIHCRPGWHTSCAIPLSAMDLNLHLLEEELREQGLTADGRARIISQVLNAECRRLSGILDNFMKFARPGSVGLHEVDVRHVIEHIMALMQFEAEERKIRLEQRVMEGSLPPCWGMRRRSARCWSISSSMRSMPCRTAGSAASWRGQRTTDGDALGQNCR